jgi:arylsulfatase A-like enzyme
VILFLGDNGTGSSITRPPFLPSHAEPSPYEGGIHVPLIVSGAIVKEPGRESTALVNSTDLFSTVAELAGVTRSALDSLGKPLDSVSLVPYLENPEAPPRRKTVFAEKFFPNHQPPKKWAYAIRDQRYKLIRTQGTMPPTLKSRWSPSVPGPEEFYDLEQDPFEQTNLLTGEPLSAPARESYEELQKSVETLLDGRSVVATETSF